MTPSERDTARAQQIAERGSEWWTRRRIVSPDAMEGFYLLTPDDAEAIQQALAEVRAEYKTPERPESLGSYMLGRD